jgi:hypothetical protein
MSFLDTNHIFAAQKYTREHKDYQLGHINCLGINLGKFIHFDETRNGCLFE